MKRFDYKYLKTYSGIRGVQYERFQKNIKAEIRKLEDKYGIEDIENRKKIENEINQSKSSLNDYEIRIINKNGMLHPTTTEIGTLQTGDELAGYIFRVFEKFYTDELIRTRCMPIYRDAIVFFDDNGVIIKILYLCFECLSIKDEDDKEYAITINGFYCLYKNLSTLGHEITNTSFT